MVQTRGQQTGDQSPSSRGSLRGVTAEGEAASTAVTSGATLKPAVSVPSTESSAAVLAGSGSGRDGPVSPLGAGSSHTISLSAPRGVSALTTGVTPKAGDGVQMTDGPRVSQGYPVIDGAMGGSANADPHILYRAQLPRNPISQSIIYGDLSSDPVTANFGSQGGVPNLFGLPAPVHAGTVPARATNTVPMAAAHARSAPAARVDQSGLDTALRHQRLAIYEAKLKQEEQVSPVPTAVVSASAPHSTEHYQMVYPGTGSASDPLRIGETASPWTCHQECAHRNALAYVRRAPSPSHTWEEVKTLLMKRFQPRGLTATYKAQFTSRRRCQTEDIYTYVETLQRLADLAWPLMDYHAKEEMVIDQFLLGMGNHELSVQVTAHGHRHMEDILRVARSLEAVQEDEKFRPRGHKPSTQARFVTDEHDHSPDTKQLVKDVLAQLR